MKAVPVFVIVAAMAPELCHDGQENRETRALPIRQMQARQVNYAANWESNIRLSKTGGQN